MTMTWGEWERGRAREDSRGRVNRQEEENKRMKNRRRDMDAGEGGGDADGLTRQEEGREQGIECRWSNKLIQNGCTAIHEREKKLKADQRRNKKGDGTEQETSINTQEMTVCWAWMENERGQPLRDDKKYRNQGINKRHREKAKKKKKNVNADEQKYVDGKEMTKILKKK